MSQHTTYLYHPSISKGLDKYNPKEWTNKIAPPVKEFHAKKIDKQLHKSYVPSLPLGYAWIWGKNSSPIWLPKKINKIKQMRDLS